MKKEVNMRRRPCEYTNSSSDKSKSEQKDYSFSSDNRINTDPLGSWTGVANDGDIYDMPVQDVDDL